MANDKDRRIIQLIERALKKNLNISNAELQEQAKKIDKTVSELSPRSFNARYPLQVKRKLSAKPGGPKWGSKKKTGRKIGKAKRKSSSRKGPQSRAASRAFSSWANIAFRDKKSELISAIDLAFDESMKSDTVSSVDNLFLRMNKAKKLF